MNKITIYSSLPYWLQNIAVSLHGYKLKRQRFNDDFYKILDFLELNPWLVKRTDSFL